MGGCMSVIYTTLSRLADKVSQGHGNRIQFYDPRDTGGGGGGGGGTGERCSYYWITEFSKGKHHLKNMIVVSPW